MKKEIIGLMAVWSCILTFSCSEKQEETINLATLNVRYDNPADSLNNWQYRKDSIACFIKKNEIDVIGMQEVLDNQLKDLEERLPKYKHIGVGREDGKTQGEYSPIFYNKEKFTLIDCNTFWLSQYPDSIGFIGWDGACTRIATWAKLKEKQTGKTLFVINTHFDHVGSTARKNSALLIIEKIKELSDNAPAIITGDFNVPEDSEAYKTLTQSDFKLFDSYKTAEKKTGVQYTFHDFGRIQPIDNREKIDYIFVTPQIKVINSHIPQEGTVNNFCMSDHNPQIISFKLE